MQRGLVREVSRDYVKARAPALAAAFPHSYYELHNIGGGLVITGPDGEELVARAGPVDPNTPADPLPRKATPWVV